MSRKLKARMGRAIGAVVEGIESRLLLSTTTFSIADATLVEGDNSTAYIGLGTSPGPIFSSLPGAYLIGPTLGQCTAATMIFTVTRTGALERPATIDYRTADGAALAGTDYVARAGQLHFEPGQSKATIGVPVIGNTQLQADRSFSVQLTQSASVFADQPTVILGATRSSLTSGDVNGDGSLDLVTGSWNADTITVLLGAGDGSFASSQNYDAGSGPFSQQLGDFNGDGNLDLATTNFYMHTVSIGLGNGNGTFQPRKIYTTGDSPASLHAADFNGDGILDLSVAGAVDNTVDVLLGNGDGSFQAARHTFANGSSYATTLGDFNGDGNVDVAAVGWISRTVNVLLGDGSGSFEPAVAYPVSSDPGSVASADFNNDGTLDLIVGGFSGSYDVLLGNGDGTFQPIATHSTGIADASLSPLAVGDFNADGNADIVTGDAHGGSVYFLPGTGQGTFGAAVALPHDNYGWARQLAVGDFNRDGSLDLAVAGDTSSLAVLVNNTELEVVLPGIPAVGTILDDDAPASLAIVAGNAQATVAGRALRISPTVVVKNARGAVVQGVSVTFTAPSDGPSGSFTAGNSATVVTDASGRAVAPQFIPNTALGDYSITTSVDGVAPVTFALHNISNAAPTLKDASIAFRQGQTFSFDRPGFDAAFRDPDGDTLQCIRITSLPAHGTLTFNGVAVIVDQEFDRNAIVPGFNTILLNGNINVSPWGFPVLNGTSQPIPPATPAPSRFTYTPDSGYGGSDAFTWNASDGSAWAATDAAVNLAVLAPVAPIVTVDASATANVNGQQPVVLKAHLTNPTASQTQVSGSVMFLDLSVDDYANALYLANRRLMPTSPMWLNNPADPNSPIAVRVLGTATVGANNTAELSLKMLMPGARRIVAVFLGNSSPLTARTTGHDAEVTLAADVHDAWAARQALIQRQYNYCTAVFNSSITGSLVLSGSGSLTLSTVILAGSTTWMTTPVVQPELRPAISDESALAVKVATGMVGGVSSGRTLTNPPSLWFQMTGLAGTMGTAPVVPSRGSIHTASASVLLTVPVPAPDPASTGFGSGACINLGFGGTLTISHPAIPYDPEPPLPNPDPAPQATGSVRIYDGDVLIDTVALDASFSGVYVPQPGSLALGTHQFYFVYDGNDDFAGFTHEDSVEITQTPTSVSLTKSVNWLAQGDSVTITANVSTATPDTVTPTGTVHFLVDGTEVAAVELGSTTPLTLTLPLGAHTIAAQYPGDNNCLPSDAVMSLLVASPAPTPTQLPAFPSIVKPSTMAVTAKVQGRQLKLMASVLDKQTRKPVAGAVEWRLDGKRVAASSIGKLLTLTPKLAKGVHTLTAVYNATLGYNTATQTLKLKATAGGITIVR